MAQKILAVFGTRPEAIKLAPLLKYLQQDGAFDLKVCVTAQHRQMLDQVLALFEIQPDFDLDLMQSEQDLSALSARILSSLRPVFAEYRPNLVLVHGDTTTAFASALSAFYHQIPVAHIEAGLRTHNIHSPFPEEANRRLIAGLAQWHFAPTATAKQNLLNEGIRADRIWVTGNTVIDALSATLQKLAQTPALVKAFAERYPFLDSKKRLILVTVHRRENLGAGLVQICDALSNLAGRHSDLQIVYPVHPNPSVREVVYSRLGNLSNLFLLEPQDYLQFISLMARAELILTDSGGIQEEATALAKKILVLRETSERPEAVEFGTARVIGTDSRRIIENVERLLGEQSGCSISRAMQNPYGDGQASARIIEILKQTL